MVVLPRAVHVYVAIVVTASALLFLVTLAARRDAWGDPLSRSTLLALLYVVAVVFAERFPLPLTAKTKVSVDTAILTAAAVVFHAPAAMAMAATAVAIHQAMLGESWLQGVFNVAQTALYVGAGSLVYHGLASRSIPPAVPQLGNLAAIVAGAATMHALNTFQVATVGALQLGVKPLSAWRAGLWLDLPEQIALVLFGLLIAVVTREEPWTLPIFALPLAIVHASLRRNVQVQAATREAVEALATLAELRDPAKAGQGRRVAELTRRLAERVGLSASEALRLAAAARVRDVGELEVDPAVLRRGGPLEPDGWAQIRRHPVKGAELVARFPAYAPIARDVLHHHERWDGGGYPDGLAGEAIPLGARLIAVADAFAAMTAARSHRPALPVETALRELERGAGAQWDPTAARAFIALVREELSRAADGVRAALPVMPTPYRDPMAAD